MYTTPHHYVVTVAYRGSTMTSELRFHDPRKAKAAMEWLFTDEDAVVVSCPNAGVYMSRGAGVYMSRGL